MKHYIKPCFDLIKLSGGDIQTANPLADILSTSTDNDLAFDWGVSTGSGTPTLTPMKGRSLVQ
jgi:hypothetical protein